MMLRPIKASLDIIASYITRKENQNVPVTIADTRLLFQFLAGAA